MNSMTQDETRREYVAGLRQLADTLEQHDELPLPDPASGNAHFTLCAENRSDMVAWALVLTDPVETLKGDIYYLTGRLGPMTFRVFAGANRIGGKTSRVVMKPTTQYVVEPLLAEQLSAVTQ